MGFSKVKNPFHTFIDFTDFHFTVVQKENSSKITGEGLPRPTGFPSNSIFQCFCPTNVPTLMWGHLLDGIPNIDFFLKIFVNENCFHKKKNKNPRCPDAQTPRCPDTQTPRCLDAQTPRCPDAQMPR